MFDAILLASYGGPEKIDDIKPFLDRILTGKRVPPPRRAAIFERYERFGGVSPLPGECRRFLDRLTETFADVADAPRLYWANLYAPPTFDDALARIETDGVRRLLVFPTSAFGSPQSCRRYVDAVRDAVRRRSPEFAARLQIAQTPPFFDLPAYRRAAADALLSALAWDELDSHPFDADAPFAQSTQTPQNADFNAERASRFFRFSARSVSVVRRRRRSAPTEIDRDKGRRRVKIVPAVERRRSVINGGRLDRFAPIFDGFGVSRRVFEPFVDLETGRSATRQEPNRVAF